MSFNSFMRNLFGDIAVDVVTSFINYTINSEDTDSSDEYNDNTEDLGYAVIVEDDNLSC